MGRKGTVAQRCSQGLVRRSKLGWPRSRAADCGGARRNVTKPSIKLACFALAVVPANVYAQTQPGSLPPIGVADKLRIHALRVIMPDKWLGWAAYSGLQQLRNDPREWGQGATGYGRRVASNAGYTAVRNVLGFGLDSTLREDPRYYKSKRTGFKPRTADALRQIFICHTDSGG